MYFSMESYSVGRVIWQRDEQDLQGTRAINWCGVLEGKVVGGEGDVGDDDGG